MPIYEYFCPGCDLKFELLRPLSQASEGAECPRCKDAAERILSAFCSVSRDESGFTTPIGGSSCGGCSTGTCGTCGTKLS